MLLYSVVDASMGKGLIPVHFGVRPRFSGEEFRRERFRSVPATSEHPRPQQALRGSSEFGFSAFAFQGLLQQSSDSQQVSAGFVTVDMI